ncbi:exonuclease SbcCD subunit D, partial [Candidatus Woesearchaeota archaeon]|nr:exonuclease SbcCD subunit D [Candidatus Woesearchaeota archaeon]
ADLHLGAWREQKMRDLSTKAFLTAIDNCIEDQVDFILFAGDLFNTSLPAVDTLKIVTKKLKELKDNNIPLYVIAGSHDFSPSGKTMLDVLEHAGLLTNVCKGSVNPETKELHLQFTVDKKTDTKITGILGRRGLLDKTYYQNLYRTNLEEETGYKIFMFHTTITEMKPVELAMIDSTPISFLPQNFNYYAGGHIHHPTNIQLENYGTLTYTGALWPNSFSEVEKYGQGGYYIINVNNNEQQVTFKPLKLLNHLHLTYNCSNKAPEVITFEIINHFNDLNCDDSLITLRIIGTLQQGNITNINFKEIYKHIYNKGAYFIMRNTAKVQTHLFEEVKISPSNPQQVENELIQEHLQQTTIFSKEIEKDITKTLLTALNSKKQEGETITDFNQRIISVLQKTLQL